MTVAIEQLESRRLFVAGPSPALAGVVVDGPRPIVAQSTITLSAATVSPIRVDLSWTVSGSVTPGAFTIERAAGDGAFAPITTVASTDRSFQSTNLSSNTTYKYRLRMSGRLSNVATART